MNRFFFLYFILLPALFFNGCDRIYSLLHKEGAEEKELLGEWDPSQPHAKIIEVQKLLKLFGVYAGSPDGKLGPRTREALAEFQASRSLEVSRFIDHATWTELQIFSEHQLVIQGEVNIVMAQTALQRAGCRPGRIDGLWGPRTDKALRAFQKAQGLKVDGKIGFHTLTELQKILSQPSTMTHY